MFVRLAFAVVANVDADVLVIDEALAVGDAVFTQKCMRFLRRFQEQGTILFVSHDTGAVLNLCRRALWLSKGQLMQVGPAKQVVEAYMRSNVETTQRLEGIEPQAPNSSRDVQDRAPSADAASPFGAGGAVIASVGLLNEGGTPISTVKCGEVVTLRVEVAALQEISSAIVGFNFKDRLGQVIFGENTCLASEAGPVALSPGDVAVAEFRFEMPGLRSGKYALDLAVAEGTRHHHLQHQWFFDKAILEVVNDRPVVGVLTIPFMAVRLGRREQPL
jgi:lipopolysaccharide transport system ATP-binding protein